MRKDDRDAVFVPELCDAGTLQALIAIGAVMSLAMARSTLAIMNSPGCTDSLPACTARSSASLSVVRSFDLSLSSLGPGAFGHRELAERVQIRLALASMMSVEAPRP